MNLLQNLIQEVISQHTRLPDLEYIHFLTTHAHTHSCFYVVNFAQTPEGFKQQSYETHLLATQYPLHNFQPVSFKADLIQLVYQFAEEQQLFVENIKEIKHFQEAENLTLFIRFQPDWHKLPAHQLRFYYYKVLFHKAYFSGQEETEEKCLSLQNEEQRKFYIQRVTQKLEITYQDIFRLIPAEYQQVIYHLNTDFSETDIYKLALRYIDQALEFIGYSYAEYISLNTFLPYSKQLLVNSELTAIIQEIRQSSFFTGLDNNLRDLLEGTLFSTAQKFRLSYGEVIYHKKVLSDLEELCRKTQQSNTIALVHRLFANNFNAFPFFNYVSNYVILAKNREKCPQRQLNILYFYLKKCEQKTLHTSLSYRSERCSIKEQLKTWLKGEIEYLEKFRQNFTTQTSGKLDIHLSVAQLAYLTKLLHKSGLFGTISQRELCKSFAQNIQTPQQKNISSKSLMNKMYEVEYRDKEKIREVITQMLQETSKEE